MKHCSIAFYSQCRFAFSGMIPRTIKQSRKFKLNVFNYRITSELLLDMFNWFSIVSDFFPPWCNLLYKLFVCKQIHSLILYH